MAQSEQARRQLLRQSLEKAKELAESGDFPHASRVMTERAYIAPVTREELKELGVAKAKGEAKWQERLKRWQR